MPSDELNLTWPALLAHWTAFAQASLALPKSAEGERWRGSVASIISLQAVTFALGDLDRLARDDGGTEHPGEEGRGEGERAFALDKAEILIRTHAAELHTIWRGEPLHDELETIIADARIALSAAREGGVEWRVTDDRLMADHPADLVALALDAGLRGDLYVPTPGVPLFRNAPAAFAREPDGSRPNERVIRAVKEFLRDVGKPERVPGPRQVYRQFDFAKGGAVRDLVVPLAQGLPAGQPLLVPAVLGGRAVGVTLPPRKGVEIPALPVIFELQPPT